MRSRLRIAALYCVLIVLVCDSAAAQQFHLSPVTRTRLANGMRLVLMEYHRAPTLTVRVVCSGGTKLDPAERTGATSLMTTLLKRGTNSRTAPQIAEAIDYLGGSLETGADDERTFASLDVLKKDADLGLDLLSDILRHPTFPTDELERERGLLVSSLQSIGEDPGRVASYVLSDVMFSGHPYGRQETVSSIKAVTQEDIAAAYRSAISPDRMILVAVGDFKTAELAAKLNARFADWTAVGASEALTPPVPRPRIRRILIDKPDATQTQVRLAGVGISRTSSDYDAAELASAILGGGFTSRLVDEVRVNRSLTYGIGSSFVTEKAGGLFEVSTFTKIESTRALLDSVRSVLAKAVQTGITVPELRKVKAYLAGQYAVHLETPEALAGDLASAAFYGLADNYMETYLARLRAVTLPQVNRAAKRFFDPGGLTVVLVGPASKIEKQLTSLGEFENRPVASVAN